MDLTVRYSARCWKCDIELLEQNRFNSRCPRCACDLSDEPIDLEDFDIEERKFWKAATDLVKVWRNWELGYKRLMNEQMEPDYSLVHEFCTEVLELSFPYIGRLKLPPLCMQYLKNELNEITSNLLEECCALEHVLLLTGQWSEWDEEVKKEWLGKLGFISNIFAAACSEQKRIES